MTKSRQLLIYGQLPDADSLEKLRRFSATVDSEWLLFPLNSTVVMPEKIDFAKATLAPLGQIEWVEDYRVRFDREVQHLGHRLESFARATRSTIVDGKTVEEHLSCSGMESAWWFGLLQERNPFLYPGWNDWVKLAMVEAFLKEHHFDKIVILGADSLLLRSIQQVVDRQIDRLANKLMIVLKDNGDSSGVSRGRSMIRDFLSGLKEWVKLGRRILGSKSLKAQDSKSLESADIIHIGYYPAADPTAAKQGIFRNKYLGHLQEIMEESASLGFLFYMVPGKHMPFKQCLSDISGFRKSGSLMRIQEEYLGCADWFRVGIQWIRLLGRSSRLLKSLSEKLIDNQILRETEAEFFASIWKESFRSHLAVKGFFNYASFRNFLKQLPSETLVIYASEFQSWEYMLDVAANSIGKHQLVAAIQGNPARNYFQYRFDKAHQETGIGFPKRIVGFSPVFDSLEGIAGAEILKGSAIRLMHLQGFEKRIAANIEKKTGQLLGILGAGSYDECVLMLEMLHASWAELSERPSVRLRLHPVIALERLSTMLSFDLESSGIAIDTGSMHDLLTDSTGIYVSNSTSAIEALAYGCEVISPRYYGRLSLCPLDGHETCYWRVSDERELAYAIGQIMVGKKRATPDNLTQFISGLVNLDPSYSTWRELIQKHHS